MKRVMSAALVGVLLSGTSLVAAAKDHGKKPKKHPQVAHASDHDRDTHVAVAVRFGSADVRILRDHYQPRYRNLPPGLRKKVARGGQLPPGWQKKFEPFPTAIERQLPPLPQGHRRGVIDGHAVIFRSRTNAIVDVAVLF